MTGESRQAVRSARRSLRLEVCAWQRAAAGLLAVSIAANAALYGLLNQQAVRHARELDELYSELRTAERIRDHAVRELGSLTEEIEREAEQAAYAALDSIQYIGCCTITAYCPCEACCGRWADGLTASGLPAGPGIVAVDPEIIPLGSTVLIDGRQYLAADTGDLVQGLHVDICMETHAAAEEFGVQKAEVWVVGNG